MNFVSNSVIRRRSIIVHHLPDQSLRRSFVRPTASLEKQPGEGGRGCTSVSDQNAKLSRILRMKSQVTSLSSCFGKSWVCKLIITRKWHFVRLVWHSFSTLTVPIRCSRLGKHYWPWNVFEVECSLIAFLRCDLSKRGLMLFGAQLKGFVAFSSPSIAIPVHSRQSRLPFVEVFTERYACECPSSWVDFFNQVLCLLQFWGRGSLAWLVKVDVRTLCEIWARFNRTVWTKANRVITGGPRKSELLCTRTKVTLLVCFCSTPTWNVSNIRRVGLPICLQYASEA